MKKLYFALCFILIILSAFWNISVYAAGGAGGSWGDDSGYDGDGGSTGGSGGGGSWDSGFGGDGGSDRVCQDQYQYRPPISSGTWHTTGSAACSQLGSVQSQSLTFNNGACYTSNGNKWANLEKRANPTYDPDCIDPDKPLKCPAGYVKKGDNTCVWQCPAGYKMLGGNCVKDDMPEDCDPAIQTCDENGEPVCDCCGALTQLVNMTNTQINNDNRIISLSETSVSNQNTIINNTKNINNNINNVNNNISTVNNNLTTINESIENIITTIENNKPDFDTSGIEAKLQQLIDKNMTIDGADIEIDFTPLLAKLDELNASIKANKYDDTSLKAKIDELINKDLSEITDRQDEQTSLLEDIKRLLMPTNEAGDPDLNLPEAEASVFDPWGAIKGFNISQNMINASGECPADKTFTVMGATFSIPMTPMCTYLSYLAPIFLAMAYFQGAMIILRSGD